MAEVEFNKNYPFMGALSQGGRAREGWPEDASMSVEERGKRFIEQGLHWCDFRAMADLVERGPWRYSEDEPDEGMFRGQPAATLAFMRSFEREGIRTRVLFYES